MILTSSGALSVCCACARHSASFRRWAYTTVYNRFNRWSRQGGWRDAFHALTGNSDIVISTITPSPSRLGGRRKRQGFDNTIRASRGERMTKIRALTDERGRLRALVLMASNMHDLFEVAAMLRCVPTPQELPADRDMARESYRTGSPSEVVKPAIPPNPTRKDLHAYDPVT